MFTEKTKYFTPKEANNTLPLVKQIARDIIANTARIKLFIEDHPTQVEGSPEIEKWKNEIDHFKSELNEIGCFYKDWNFVIGLVNFPALIHNEEVFLCWRSDEEEIAFYYSPQDGYEGRTPIPEEYFEPKFDD